MMSSATTGLQRRRLIGDSLALARFALDPNAFRAPRIVINCMPKTGSTSLMTILAHLPGMKTAKLYPFSGHREQEMSRVCLARAGKGPLVAQIHCKYSSHTAELLTRFKLSQVLLRRDLFDVCVSLRDHILNDKDRWPIESSPTLQFDVPPATLDEEELLVYICRVAMPWYINYHVGWRSRPGYLALRYEDMIRDMHGTVAEVVAYAGAGFSDAEITQAIDAASKRPTRRNVGVAGRGRTLPRKAVTALREIIEAAPGRKGDPYLTEMLEVAETYLAAA